MTRLSPLLALAVAVSACQAAVPGPAPGAPRAADAVAPVSAPGPAAGVALDGDVTLRFRAVVGDRPFRSGVAYPDLGTRKSTATGLDFRFYVHHIRLLTAGGAEVPLTLKASPWQLPAGTATGPAPARGLALLDFDTTATPATNDRVEGTVPAGAYTGVRFVLGLPPAENHIDAASAPGPLGTGFSGMFWSWQSGYKQVKIDLEVARPMAMGYRAQQHGAATSGANFVIHMGASGCSGDPVDGYTCTRPNAPEVTIAGFDPTRDAIAADLGALVAGSDLSAGNGCHSAADDAECPPVMRAIGNVADVGQTFFRRTSL